MGVELDSKDKQAEYIESTDEYVWDYTVRSLLAQTTKKIRILNLCSLSKGREHKFKMVVNRDTSGITNSGGFF